MTDFSVVGTHPFISLQLICCSFKTTTKKPHQNKKRVPQYWREHGMNGTVLQEAIHTFMSSCKIQADFTTRDSRNNIAAHCQGQNRELNLRMCSHSLRCLLDATDHLFSYI